VSGEVMAKDLWNKLGNLCQSKSLVNIFFLQKKMYNLRMKDGDSVIEHLNTFYTIVSQLLFVDINSFYEDKCISLFFSLPDSWDNLVVAIGSNTTTLSFDDVVPSLLSEEMRWKNMEEQGTYALFVRGCSQERNRSKSLSGRSKSKGRSKSPRKFVRYVGDVEKKGTTRSNVDPKVLREVRDMKMFLLQKKKPMWKKEGVCTWLIQAHM
jgi:hypothetical protein